MSGSDSIESRIAASLEARNLGVGLAPSELITFIDHDYDWRPLKLHPQGELVGDHPDALVVRKFRWWRDVLNERPTRVLQAIRTAQCAARAAEFGSGSLKRVRRCGGPNPYLAQMQDWDLLLRLAIDGRTRDGASAAVGYNLPSENASREYQRVAGERYSILRDHEWRAGRREDSEALAAVESGGSAPFAKRCRTTLHD